MAGFLGLVAVISYLFAGFIFLVAFGASDIQFILAGVFATCGTVAAAGAAVVSRLDMIDIRLRLQAKPAETPSSGPSSEELAGM